MNKLYLFLGMMVLGLSALFFAPGATAYAADFYIGVDGNDANTGSKNDPFASISRAQDAASSGDTVYIMGGTYKNFEIAKSDSNYNYVHNITKSGITYRAYTSKDMPIFDFSNVPTNKRVAAFRIAYGAMMLLF